MKRKLLLSVALLLIGAVGATVWASWRHKRSTTIALADGSRLEFLDATFGANCSFNYASPWRRLAARLPRGWTQRLGLGAVQNEVVNAGYSGDSSVVFWFVRRGMPPGATISNVAYRAFPNGPNFVILGRTSTVVRSRPSAADGLAINLKDEQGDGVPGLRQLGEVALPSGDSALYWRTDVVPSASRVVFLRLYENGKGAGWKCVGELEVPNPFLRTAR
jgi:hypothetical protein